MIARSVLEFDGDRAADCLGQAIGCGELPEDRTWVGIKKNPAVRRPNPDSYQVQIRSDGFYFLTDYLCGCRSEATAAFQFGEIICKEVVEIETVAVSDILLDCRFDANQRPLPQQPDPRHQKNCT
ncbi:hypothetical protein [Paracoccus sp. SY]|uniref:hypothetical protein n=1 Tax=Paracoccus sp. SY TaxID=1330255 RepID=UPI001304FEAF|nr:hypothetical protein [Paracoccus sp. SY]